MRIHTDIAQDSPQNATEMIDRIMRRAERTGDLPHIGRKVPECQVDTLREILERPYRIIYRIRSDDELRSSPSCTTGNCCPRTSA